MVKSIVKLGTCLGFLMGVWECVAVELFTAAWSYDMQPSLYRFFLNTLFLVFLSLLYIDCGTDRTEDLMV